jgi:hypothetical protein
LPIKLSRWRHSSKCKIKKVLQYHHYIELVAFSVGVACFNKNWLPYYKVLFFLVGLTCLVEMAGSMMSYEFGDNNWLYNIFSPIECFIILYFFSRIILKRRLKELIFYSIPIMVVATCITYMVQPNFMVYNSYARTIYLVLWIIASGFFFIDVMINDNRMSLVKQPGFWLATGILFFSVIFIVLISMYKIFKILPNYKIIINYFNIVANTFLYVGFIGAFLCQRIATKYYSRSLQQA